VPTVRRGRSVAADVEDVWKLLSDPERLPEWWPGAQRVEEVEEGAWTLVLSTPRGKQVRADYSLVDSEPLRELLWRQEVEESPFERIMSESLTRFALEPEDDSTHVTMSNRIRLRGFSHFGVVQVRLAARRQLDGALEGLQSALEAPG
jgi:uncharacterized protein YndB with AHSA1/START domain